MHLDLKGFEWIRLAIDREVTFRFERCYAVGMGLEVVLLCNG
jgi:hypothetical protein